MSGSFLLTSPNAIGLPPPERGDVLAPATRAVVDERWPQIDRLLADGQAAAAISSMEALAAEMRRATGGDAPLFRDALTLARRILYDDITQVGRSAECKESAHAALDRCAVWDQELRVYLQELISSERN